MESPYFDDVRSLSLEKGSKIKLLLDIDQLDAYDYTARQSHKYTKQDYVKMIYKECQIHRRKR